MSFLNNILGGSSSGGGLLNMITENSIGLNLLGSIFGNDNAQQIQQYGQEGQQFWNEIKDGEIDANVKADNTLYLLVFGALALVIVFFGFKKK